MKETFINPLLHPYANASSSTVIEYDDLSARITSHASHRGGQSNLDSSPGHGPWWSPAYWVPGDSSTLPCSSQLLRLPPGIAVTLPRGGLDRLCGIASYQLPDELRRCPESIRGILADHLKLVEALRKRYDEQYPLVRSLVDIF
ncbi:hypothetical protein F5888DRAFT_1121837 [Russula emetica]|nr:hypothetical protein F5888DRAFT_1121837 [Russula emetica]